METEKQNNTGEVIRLPLWKSCLEDMLKAGVEHGQTYEAKFFEDKLKCERDSMQFGLSMSEIRRHLERHGYYISGRGQNGNQFIILPPENNKDIMSGYQRAAIDALKRGVVLGTHTRIDLLAESDRRKHEAVLEKMAFKAVLMQRSQAIRKVVLKHAPKILAEKAE